MREEKEEDGEGRAKIARKLFRHKNVLTIWQMMNNLLVVFTYLIIYLKNKKKINPMILETVTFLCKTVSTYWHKTNQGTQIH